jgi:hypothetical protein
MDKTISITGGVAMTVPKGLVLVFVLALLWVAGGGSAEGQKQSMDEDGYWSISAGDVQLQWKVEEKSLQVIVSAPTTGWIAVGFDATVKMKNANIIIGYVKNEEVFLRDDFGIGPTAHQDDEKIGGQNDISEASGAESKAGTELRFTIPLDSQDSKDRVLVEGQEYKVILAYGKKGSDSFTTYHARKRTSVKIKL